MALLTPVREDAVQRNCQAGSEPSPPQGPACSRSSPAGCPRADGAFHPPASAGFAPWQPMDAALPSLIFIGQRGGHPLHLPASYEQVQLSLCY